MVSFIQKFIYLMEHLRTNHNKIFEICFLISALFIVLIVGIIIGTVIFELESGWAIFPMNNWIYAGIVSTVFFILLDFFFLFSYFIRKEKCAYKKSRIEYVDGEKTYVFTNPKGIVGGIFSKTYLQADKDTYMCVRYPMVLLGEMQQLTEQ